MSWKRIGKERMTKEKASRDSKRRRLGLGRLSDPRLRCFFCRDEKKKGRLATLRATGSLFCFSQLTLPGFVSDFGICWASSGSLACSLRRVTAGAWDVPPGPPDVTRKTYLARPWPRPWLRVCCEERWARARKAPGSCYSVVTKEGEGGGCKNLF